MALNSVPQPNQCPEYPLAHRGLCTRVCVRRDRERERTPDTQRPDLYVKKKDA